MGDPKAMVFQTGVSDCLPGVLNRLVQGLERLMRQPPTLTAGSFSARINRRIVDWAGQSNGRPL